MTTETLFPGFAPRPPAPKPPRHYDDVGGPATRITFYIADADLRRLDELSARTGTGRPKLIREAIADLLRILDVTP